MFLMLMTIAGLIAAAVLLSISLIKNMPWLRDFVFGAVALWLVFYAVVLLGFSFASEEKLLAPGEAKAFCGFYLDCHMHAAVTDVRRSKTIGGRAANGEFYIVRVQVFSDAARATLGLNTVDAHVVDADKHTYSRDSEAESQLPAQPPFEKHIGPAESFEKEIVFDLPPDIKNARLDLREGFGIDYLIETVLVDDEDSILHERELFMLDKKRDGSDQTGLSRFTKNRQ